MKGCPSMVKWGKREESLIHYANNGCLKSRRLQLYRYECTVTKKISKVTCPICLKRIARKGLIDRYEFPEVPTFKVEIENGVSHFTCPVCGIVNVHGIGPKDHPVTHAESHCDCWERGYYLDKSIASQPSAKNRGNGITAIQKPATRVTRPSEHEKQNICDLMNRVSAGNAYLLPGIHPLFLTWPGQFPGDAPIATPPAPESNCD